MWKQNQTVWQTHVHLGHWIQQGKDLPCRIRNALLINDSIIKAAQSFSWNERRCWKIFSVYIGVSILCAIEFRQEFRVFWQVVCCFQCNVSKCPLQAVGRFQLLVCSIPQARHKVNMLLSNTYAAAARARTFLRIQYVTCKREQK